MSSAPVARLSLEVSDVPANTWHGRAEVPVQVKRVACRALESLYTGRYKTYGSSARPRTFDEDAALSTAVDCFWQHGYAATSVRDLGAAMGLGAPSLYNAFGDKRTLFARCLDRYLDVNIRERIGRLEASLPPCAAITTFLDEIVARSLADPRGRLLVNSALEVAPHDAEIGAVVAERLGEIEAFIHRCVGAGQRDGSIAALHPPADLARLLLITVIGLRVLARARPEPELLRGAARQALALLVPEGAAQ